MTMTQPTRSGSRWPRRVVELLFYAACVYMIILAYVWTNKVISAPRSTTEKFAMHVSYEQGPESKKSRCAGDCSQPGDIYTAAIIRRGPQENTTAIYMFDDLGFLVACWDCTLLSFVAQHLGKLHVVGVSTSKHCQIDRSSLDSLAESAQRCGTIEHSSFDIR